MSTRVWSCFFPLFLIFQYSMVLFSFWCKDRQPILIEHLFCVRCCIKYLIQNCKCKCFPLPLLAIRLIYLHYCSLISFFIPYRNNERLFCRTHKQRIWKKIRENLPFQRSFWYFIGLNCWHRCDCAIGSPIFFNVPGGFRC